MYRALPERTKKTIRELVQQGMNYRDVAASLHVSVGAVHNAVHDEKYEPDDDIQKAAAVIRRQMAAKCLVLADAILESVSQREVVDASLKELAIAAAILTDKAVMLDPSVVNRNSEVQPVENKEENDPAPALT